VTDLISLTSVVGTDNPPAIPTRLLYSPAEAEQLLGVSHATLYRLIKSRRLDARKVGSSTRITAQSIHNLIARLPQLGGES
jgi:excisionase family DNA binding protein